ncbi:MAG: hypothetical protein U9R08_04760 [Nanoarchaeota archaeon]|nr:hypothetical protein [Nanoarchaeota archaeon]
MKLKNIANTLLLTSALAILPQAQAALNICQPQCYEDSIDQKIESVKFNTKKGRYEIIAEVNGKKISEGFYYYEQALVKAGIENEQERNIYLEQMHKKTIPIIAKQKFKNSMTKLHSWNGIKKLESVLGKEDTKNILPYIITESGGDLKIKRTRGHCYGILQVKYPVYIDTINYFKRNPKLRSAKKIKKIKWKDLKKRLVAPQSRIFLGYQNRIDEMYQIYTKGRMKQSDKQRFRDLGWNLGPVVVGKTVKEIHGPNISYNETKFKIVSPNNLKQYSSYKKFSDNELMQKKAISLAYPEFCKQYRILLETIPKQIAKAD